jgi:hypothetical protein
VGKPNTKERKLMVLAKHRRNNRLRSAKGVLSGSDVLEENPDNPDQLSGGMESIMGGLVDPAIQYTFRIVQARTYTAVSGAWSVYTNLDPSLCTEWTGLCALFSEYKLKEARMTIVPLGPFAATSPNTSNPYLSCGFDLGQSSVVPANHATVLATPASRMISLIGGGKENFRFTTGNVSHLFQFQAAVPSPTLEPYAGSYGQWWAYGYASGAADVFSGYIEMDIIFTGRG